jgi:hypothetical protein
VFWKEDLPTILFTYPRGNYFRLHTYQPNAMRTQAAIFLFIIALSSCKDGVFPNAGSDTYIDHWTGEYEGPSRYSRRWQTNSYTEDLLSKAKRMVKASVVKGETDSTLTMMIFVDNQTIHSHKEIHVNDTGIYLEEAGGDSNLRIVKIQFSIDSLHYFKSQRCGWFACHETIEFAIPKN